MTALDFQTWVQTYKPILNPNVQTSYFDGYYIQSVGEVEQAIEMADLLNEDNVWTIGKDDEGNAALLSGLYEYAEGETLGYVICRVAEQGDLAANFPEDHVVWNNQFLLQVDNASGKYRFGDYGKRALVSESNLPYVSAYSEDGGPLVAPQGQEKLIALYDDWVERYDVVCCVESEQDEEYGREQVRFLIEEVDAHFVWSEDLVHNDQSITHVTRGNAGDVGDLVNGVFPVGNQDRAFFLARNPWRKNLVDEVYTRVQYGCSDCNPEATFENDENEDCESCYGTGTMLLDCKTGEFH
jgi:hypothetical protein